MFRILSAALLLSVGSNAEEIKFKTLVDILKGTKIGEVEIISEDTKTVSVSNGDDILFQASLPEPELLYLRTSWNTPSKSLLDDLPAINLWNHKYRFAKLSLEEHDGTNHAVMHLDQFLPPNPAQFESFIRTAVETFTTSMQGFGNAYKAFHEAEDEDEADQNKEL
eukprot:TRINITY_DN7161_c0_g1_i1.p1 TRINITY_DN7161_c0_g1~~TRINITY_DN7161_c0_g1_i1.p1  ORF type:complete len:188 (+),score=33.50 TRINITY_DN7161_c0_g1_i1:69-566(+)